MKGTTLHQILCLLLLLLLYLLITSDHHATVGNCDSVSSMSTVTWEPAAVQVYDKSVSIPLTLDMNGISKIGLDIIGADCMVNSLPIERETCVISSITDQVPFLEYEDLCNDVRKAFPDLASLINSIESALAKEQNSIYQLMRLRTPLWSRDAIICTDGLVSNDNGTYGLVILTHLNLPEPTVTIRLGGHIPPLAEFLDMDLH